jgi:hypothetical protein
MLPPLEILHSPLMALGGSARLEGSQIASTLGLWIKLAGIQSILA